MIINRQGQLVANIAQPTVIFETKEAYTTWLGSLPDSSCEANFIVIKTYELAPGGVYELATNAEREALPKEQKVNETLYIVTEDNSGWRWTPESEPDADDGFWTQLFGEGFAFEYVIAVETFDDLATVEPKAENIIYIVKDENALYRFVIDSEEPFTGHFEKAAGAAAPGLQPTATAAELDPTEIEPDVNVYVTEYNQFFKHDNEDEEDDLFYANVGEHVVYAERPTDESIPAIDEGQLYFDKDASGKVIIKMITDKTDTTGASDFVMDPTAVETGIFFENTTAILNNLELLSAEGLIDFVVDPVLGNMFVPMHSGGANLLRGASNATTLANCLKRVNSHGGEIGYYFANYASFPAPTALTIEEQKGTFVDMSTGKAYQVTGNPLQYVERGMGEQDQEVITVQDASYLPAIPAKGVIYIVEKVVGDATKVAGEVKIANPLADFTQPASETNKYYLDVGTDISALIKRIQELEDIANDVRVVRTEADLPNVDTMDDKNLDVLYVVLETRKSYVVNKNVAPGTGAVTYNYVQTTGDDLITMMPSMTLTDWKNWDIDHPGEQKPDYVNIVPDVDAGEEFAQFDGFAYTYGV